MITEDGRFIEIQAILAVSNVHPKDCTKINDLIIELSKERNQFKEYTNHNYDKAKQLQQENKQLKDNWNELKKYAKKIISTDNELYGTDLLDKMQEIQENSNKLKRICKIMLGNIPKRIYITKDEYLEYKKLQQENKQLQKQITVMKEYLGLITDLSFDYDGCNTVESLKSLIDDLKRYAKLGREGNLTEPIYTNDNDSYNMLHQKIRKDSTNE